MNAPNTCSPNKLPSQLKVRVGDYDLRDFKEPETRNFKEMGIVKIIRYAVSLPQSSNPLL